MKSTYGKLNIGLGWLVFAASASTFLLTKEPTGSWWDCGEFLSAAYKMEVVHEPGSPLFLMIGKLFALLAGHRSQIAPLVNASSAIASAGTVLFLFWSITALARKITFKAEKKEEEYTPGKIYAVMGAGIVGALAYCWSDTFWFSAVESEVYALSSFCTALVFWAILKWDACADEPRATKWLLFIAYVMGLSIGVHLLNLLTIPALTFVYYFRKYKVSLKGILITSAVAVFILAGILYGIIPWMIGFAAKFDVYAVNSMGMPFNSGACVFFLLVLASLILGIRISLKRQMPLLNAALLGICFILIGYGSYAMVIIRANANTPLNNSNPNNFISLMGYLGREQYQESPLLYGQDFTARVSDVTQGEMRYRKGNTKYEEIGPKPEYVYDKEASMLFPRIWDSDHASEYRSWLGLKSGEKPGFADNLRFFFSYQLNYMYWRYFMWNFAGRQNDTPSAFPNPTKGNWLSGIPFADALFLGNQDALPDSMSKNKAFNRLFFLPLLLGLAGLFFQYRKSKQGFSIVLLLFLFTGLAIVVYLNMPPSQPRERDYAFAGSFYAFAIWIGLGVLFIYELFARKWKSDLAAIAAGLLCFLAVPMLMAFQEWNDHDRSNRYTTRDFAENYLSSCAPGAILFTYGDNETYPLWYAQEVEGFRTDVRVINLSLFDGSWCIDKCKLPVNKSAALPISWQSRQYADGIRDYFSFENKEVRGYTELQDLLDFMGSDNPSTMDENHENFLPTKDFQLSVNKQEVLDNHVVDPSQSAHIVSKIQWTFNHNSISKGQVIFLDILAHNHWKRPVYFCETMGSDSYMGLDSYLQLEGIVYHLVPLQRDSLQKEDYRVDQNLMYHNIMDLYHWGNLNGTIHIDDQTNSFASSFKDLFLQLATSLYSAHKTDSCVKVIDRCIKEIPPLPPLAGQLGEDDFADLHFAQLYYNCHHVQQGTAIMNRQLEHIRDEYRYANSQGSPGKEQRYSDVFRNGEALLTEMQAICKAQGQTALLAQIQSLRSQEK